MGNLISSIQHLVVIIFTTVTTAVMVILPFHKPSVHPNLSSKQEVQIKKDATSSASVLGANKTDSPNQKTELKPKPSSSTTPNPTSSSAYTQTSQNNTNNSSPGQQSNPQSTLPAVNNIYIILPTQTLAPTATPIPTSTPYPTLAPTSTPSNNAKLDQLTRAQEQAKIDSIRGGQNINLSDLKPLMSDWFNTFDLSQGYPLSKSFMVNHLLDDLQSYQGVVQ